MNQVFKLVRENSRWLIRILFLVGLASTVLSISLTWAQSAPPVISGESTTCENENGLFVVSCAPGTAPYFRGSAPGALYHQLPYPPYTSRPDNSSAWYIYGSTAGVYSVTFACATENPVYGQPSTGVPVTLLIGTTNPNNPNISTQSKTISAGQSLTLTSGCTNSTKWSTGEQTPNIVVSPTRTTSYSVTCPVSSTTNGCIAITKYQINVNQVIRHYHQLTTNPNFDRRQLIGSIPGSEPFKVCADGSLASIFTFIGGNIDYNTATLTLPSEELKHGSFSVIVRNSDSLVVRYKHPTLIEEGASIFRTTALLNVSGSQPVSVVIEISPAPVVMVHGLWSSKESFEALENKLYQTGIYSLGYLERADYSASNNLRFSSNVIVVPTAISAVIAQLRAKNVAAGAADVIGHSMGGILSRLYLQSTGYRSDIHKLITINTPHSGSQVANFLLDITNQAANDAFCGPTFRRLLDNNTLCNAGAIDDLRVNSLAIDSDLNGSSLNRNPVPSHAIVTADYTDISELENTLVLVDRTFIIKWVLNAYASNFENRKVFYPEIENDQIVSVLSQKGGLTGQCTSYVPNQSHIGSPANLQVMSIILRLLSESSQGSSFCARFSPYPLDYNPQRSSSGYVATTQVDNSTALTITSPVKGSYYSPGSDVSITANGSGLSEIRTFIRYTYDSVYVAKKAGSSVNYTAPVGSYYGRRDVIVLGKTASGQSISDSSHFFVRYNLCKSIQTGNWEDETTWTCGRVPNQFDIVILQANHLVTVNNPYAFARRVIYSGGSIRFNSSEAKLNIYSYPD